MPACLHRVHQQHGRQDYLSASQLRRLTEHPPMSVCLQSSDSLHISAEQAAQAGEQGEQDCAVTPLGLDTAEFLLSAGPSEPLRSLAATASGGESARVMLALKAAPAAIPPVPNDAAGAPDQGGPGDGAMRLSARELIGAIPPTAAMCQGGVPGVLLSSMPQGCRSPANQCITELPDV